MPTKGRRPSGDSKLEDSSGRKRQRPSQGRDIGWEHGEMVDGNRFHWKCKWCGVVRLSGGVSRLKQHLAGGRIVGKCPNVPKHVATAMNLHLLEAKRRKKKGADIGKIKSELPDLDESKMMQLANVSAKRLRAGARRPKNGAASSRRKRRRAEGGRDIGWEHGEMVGGNRFHWKCNWCGVDRLSGGVYRLKQHLAGGWHVGKCPNVPEHVASAMKERLLEMMMKKKKKKKTKGTNIELVADASTRRSERAAKRSRAGSWRAQNDVIEFGKDADATVSGAAGAITGMHLLQLPELSEGGNALSCIHNALASDPPGFTGILKIADADTAEPQDSEEQGQYLGPDISTTALLDVSETEIDGQAKIKGTAEPQDGEAQGQYRRPDISTNALLDISETEEEPQDCEAHGQYLRPDIYTNALMDVSEAEIDGQDKMNVNTGKCQNVLLDILRSEQFSQLRSLLCGTFQDSKVEQLFDFSLINANMKNGDYESSPRLFDEGMKRIWKKIEEIGQEMICLAGSLSMMSRASDQKQVGEELVHEASEQKHEDVDQVVDEQKNSNISDTMMQFPCESDKSTQPDQTEAPRLYKFCTCTRCGAVAEGQRSLICHGCEAVCHFTCAEPAVQEIILPRELPEPFQPITQQDSLHRNCMVSDTLEVSGTLKQFNPSGSAAIPDDTRKSLVSSIESEGRSDSSKTPLSHLCKKCRTSEDDHKRVSVCRSRPFWYCPSCFCKACLSNKDAAMVISCDGCDEPCHICCMKPTPPSIPRGQCFCMQCSGARAKEGTRMHEQRILQQQANKVANKSTETNSSMDVLLCALDKLCSKEKSEAPFLRLQ